MADATVRPSPVTGSLDALLALRCQALLAAASGWLDDPDDEALEGARTLVSLLRQRAALTAAPREVPAEDSFDEYVARLVVAARRFARGGAPPGPLLEAACYGHLRARNAGLSTRGDIALWVALQALLGRNFHVDRRHEALVAALTTAPALDDEGSDHLHRTLTAALADGVACAGTADELVEVRLALGPAPPPRRPPWHPPNRPW